MAKILIIDDDEAICKALSKFLQSQGHEATVAPDGKTGLTAARARPDLIICDLSMPVMGGHDVLSALRADKSLEDTPFIFLSGCAERETIRHSMNLGGDDFIPKPAELSEILTAVTARLERHQRQQQKREEVVKKAMQIFSGIVDDVGSSKAAIHWLAEAAATGGKFHLSDPKTARPEADESDSFLASKNNRQYFVKLSEIKALIADGEYSRAYWGKDQSMMFRKPLKQWEKELPASHFLRVHRKAIINLAFLEFVDKTPEGKPLVHLKGFDQVIEVSERKTSSLNKKLKLIGQAKSSRT